MEKKNKIKVLFLAIALLFSCFLTCFMPTTISTAYASNIGVVGGYTNVLEDLQQDETFNAEDYAINESDYSLQVITIAESNENELFIYVYQPSAHFGNLRATSIFMSTAYQSKSNYQNYTLSYVNSQGVFYKYVVNGFKVATTSIRAYEITNIYRAWNENIDAGTDNGNIINDVAFAVQKTFTFTTADEKTTLGISDNEYITITDKYIGFVRYDGDNNFWGTTWNCDSHFVAFSTDRQIDELLEADVYFNYTPFHYQENGQELTITKNDGSTDAVVNKDYDEVRDYILTNDCQPYDGYAYLNGEQTGVYESGKWKYEWERIQSVEDFINAEHFENTYDNGFISINQSASLTEEGKANIESQQWVLRFFETEYRTDPGWYGGSFDQTMVYNVSILRLRFQTDGITYDLGVVDNKSTGDLTPDNQIEYEYSLSDTFKIILIILLLIVLLIVLNPVLPYVFKFIGFIFKAIFWIISAPFKLIGKVFKKRE